MRHWRGLRTGLVVAAFALTLSVALAGAQDPSPVPSVHDTFDDVQSLPETARDEQDVPVPDTDVTPDAKTGAGGWKQVHGAAFGQSAAPESSVTSFDDNLVTVSFLNVENGFAGGSRLVDCDGQQVHVPVIYRYSDTPDRGLVWQQSYLGDCDAPGFVGAIAWSNFTESAMAVGGTGSYPYREPAYDEPGCNGPNAGTTEPYGAGCDQAGTARVWAFDLEQGEWDETTSEALPSGVKVRGLTALAFDPNQRTDLGFAGGLGQLWRIAKGELGGKPWDINSNRTTELRRPELFTFRVREIRFAADSIAYAVTDGCCVATDASKGPQSEGRLATAAHNTSALLRYAGGSLWSAQSIDPLVQEYFQPAFDVGAGEAVDATSNGETSRLAESRADLPDSFYSLQASREGATGQYSVSVIASPGGPPRSDAPERSSVVSSARCPRTASPLNWGEFLFPDQAAELAHVTISTARLVAGDGDQLRAFGYFVPATTSDGGTANVYGLSPGDLPGSSPLASSCDNLAGSGSATEGRHDPDAIPDWVVGTVLGSRSPAGSQGLVVSTGSRASVAPDTVDTSFVQAGDKPNVDTAKATSGSVADQARAQAYLESQYFVATSYALNAIDMVGEGEFGQGWTVGEHGAILGFGVGGSGGATGPEPKPPALSSAPPAGLPDDTAFAPFAAPPAAQAGVVPPLVQQPPEQLQEGRLVSAGSPDPTRYDPALGDVFLPEDVQTIVMSRDGSEGWALGPNRERGSTVRVMTTAYRLVAGRWTRCDPEGVRGQLEADPACSALKPLRDYGSGGLPTPVKILAATRVPLENDENPDNDDEFEVVAIGSVYSTGSSPVRRVLLRYRDGRWTVDADRSLGDLIKDDSSDPREIVFAAPDDGWVLGSALTSPNQLLHYDGHTWIKCTLTEATPGTSAVHQVDAPEACDDPERRLRFLHGDLNTGDRDDVNGLVSAGDRVYLYGARHVGQRTYPFVIYRDHGGTWQADHGGLDPVGPEPDRAVPEDAVQGTAASLAVADDGDGNYHGWAVGVFGSTRVAATSDRTVARFRPSAIMLRLVGEAWSPFADHGPIGDYLVPALNDDTITRYGKERASTTAHLQAVLPGGPDAPAFIAQAGKPNEALQGGSGRLFRFDAVRRRWELVVAERPSQGAVGGRDGWLVGRLQAVAPDGEGGIWAAVWGAGGGLSGPHVHFFRYTDHPPRPVFAESPGPLGDGETFTALAAQSDGTVWASTRSDVLWRYDRMTGWNRVRVAGWDPGLVTNPSAANAVAVNAAGDGVVVGHGGRIADITGRSVRLDDAAGTLCDLAAVAAPCGTGLSLRAASVAPDGSALVGGDRGALLWRPGSDRCGARGFRAIERPAAPAGASLSAVALPTTQRAWVATDSGGVYRGELSGCDWAWKLENVAANGDVLALDETRKSLAVRALALDADGQGYAVGDKGLVIERTGDGERPWRRLATGFRDHLTTVTLATSGGPAALIGGRDGLILTLSDGHFQIARPADYFSNGEYAGPVTGLALVPGAQAGQVEAWAATRDYEPSVRVGDPVVATSQLLHYTSADEALLAPDRRVEPLPDTPDPRAGEVAFAALGKSDCHVPRNFFCNDMSQSTEEYEVLLRATVDAIAERSRTPGGPAFAVWTGDTVDTTGYPANSAVDQNADINQQNVAGVFFGPTTAQTGGARKERRWREAVADRLADRGVPLYAAIGSQDLSDVPVCYVSGGSNCVPTRETVKAGANLDWRAAFADRPRPWGGADPLPAHGFHFAEVDDPVRGTAAGDVRTQVPVPDQAAATPGASTAAGDVPAGNASVPLGGARTHYAFDLVSNDSGEAVARFVFVDNSLRSLQASDAIQQPAAVDGQRAWLDATLCIEGTGDGCTRKTSEQVIVVANTPTYSYASTRPDDTATDAALFEQQLFAQKVNLVVSGRLGWNGMYWATAPGIHVPCPGDDYPTEVPRAETRNCATAAGVPDPQTEGTKAVAKLSRTIGSLGAPPPPAGTPDVDGAANGLNVTGTLPFVVASGAGGKFGDSGAGSAAQGFWHGYTLIRLDKTGDPARTIVEQRPVFDWIRISGPTHVLRPGQKLALRGEGREPLGVQSELASPRQVVTRFDVISSPAITHRYDLVEADPERPYVPKVVEGNGNPHGYVPLDPTIAQIDPQTGHVRAGRSAHGRLYAIAILSVGDLAASYPLVFEPKRSYTAPRQPRLPLTVVPEIRVLGFNAASLNAPTSTPPSAPPPPINTSLNLPAPPALPSFPSAAAPPITPPAPPAPPAPPGGQQGLPISVTITPVGITVPPTTGVTAQPTPPVNPSPPSGARREAKQRQAATAKSEEGGSASDAAGDLATSKDTSHGSAFTRRERIKTAADGFTPLVLPHTQASAWTTGLEWGGGIALMALALAFGFTTLRPTPRRCSPEVRPAEARTRSPRY